MDMGFSYNFFCLVAKLFLLSIQPEIRENVWTGQCNVQGEGLSSTGLPRLLVSTKWHKRTDINKQYLTFEPRENQLFHDKINFLQLS